MQKPKEGIYKNKKLKIIEDALKGVFGVSETGVVTTAPA